MTTDNQATEQQVPPAPETQGEVPPTTDDLLEGLDKRDAVEKGDEPKVQMTLRDRFIRWWGGEGSPDASVPAMAPGTTPAHHLRSAKCSWRPSSGGAARRAAEATVVGSGTRATSTSFTASTRLSSCPQAPRGVEP
jgi:hypothetical protein